MSDQAEKRREGVGFVKKYGTSRTFSNLESEPVKKSGTSRTFSAEERLAEFEAATSELTFTKDFNPSLETVMTDTLEVINVRVFAWIKRRSWGNHCLYCVKSPNGEPVFQVDCAKELNIDKQRVSAAVRYLVRRGYLEMRGTAKILYPVILPVLVAPDPDDKSEEYRTFIEDWKVSHSADNEELENARATIKRIMKVRWGLFKKWPDARTNEPCIKEERKERKTAAASAPDSGLTEEPAAAAPNPEHQEDAIILEALSRYGQTDLETARKIKLGCRDRYPDATREEVVQKIHECARRPGRRTSPIGFLVSVVPKSFEGYRRPKPVPPVVAEEPPQPRCPKCGGNGMIDFSYTNFGQVVEALKRGVQACDCKEGQTIRNNWGT